MTELLEFFSKLMLDSVWFSPILALLAGVITAFSPCCLSSVPLIIQCVGGGGQIGIKKSFKLSVVFSVGMVITSTILGIAVALLGTVVQTIYSGSWWYLFLSVIMFVMALQVWEIVHIVPSTFFISRNTKRGTIGAFLAGILAGVFSSPCSTPVLVALLTIVAQLGRVGWGAFLLFLYSVGHSVLFLFAGTFTGAMKSLMRSKKYGVLNEVIKYASGLAIMFLGLYMLYLGIG